MEGMKTQIITLENHDDLISVRDRMSWAKSPRILLVWPKYETIKLRAIDLRVLQQHAHTLGAQLGLVTHLVNVKRDAQGFGIPVFATTTEAQRNAWPVRTASNRFAAQPVHPDLHSLRATVHPREASWRNEPAVRIGFFSAGVLAVLVIAVLFVPRAKVTLTPLSQQQSLTFPVSASKTYPAVLMNGSLPAHEISVAVSGSQSAKVTAQSLIPQSKATGIARFKSLSQSSVTIPAGTVVYSVSPTTVRFVTMHDTHLDGTPNAFVDVPITALQPGAIGNLPTNSIQAIDGSVGLSASVNNPEPTTGGTDQLMTAPTDDDRKRVHDVLLPLLRSQALDQINASLGPKDLLLTNSLEVGQVMDETYDPPAGQAGSLVTVNMRVQFSVLYVKGEDLTQLAQSLLDDSIPSGFSPQPDSLTFNAMSTPALDQGGATHFILQVGRTIERQLNFSEANTLVRGLPPGSAVKVLTSRLPLAQPPQIQMTPAWWPWMPLIPFRIDIQ